MKPTLDMAVASGMDLGQACDIISDNVSALGLEVKDTTMLVDVMAKTSSSSNTTIEMMGEAFKYVAPLSKTLGINVIDLSTAIGVLGNNGIKAGQAGNVLKTGLARLSAPTKAMKNVMDKYNISLQKNSDGSVDLMKTIKHLKSRIGDLDKTTQAQVISTLMGKEALSGWASLINTSEADLDALNSTIADYNGTASEMAEIMGDNLQGSIKAMKSAFEGVMITVGDMFIPILKKVVDSITGVLRKFNEMDSGAQKLIVAIGATTAVIAPLMTVIGTLGGSIMRVIPLLSSVASGMGLTLSASTALIGGLVAIGVAFAGLLGWMGSSSEMISYLQTEFGAFGVFLSSLGEFIYGTFQLTFGNIGILIKTLGKMLMALVKGDFKEVGNIWKDGWAEMEVNTAKAGSNMAMHTANATKKMREMSTSELSALEHQFNSTMDVLKTVTVDNIDEATATFVSLLGDMDNEAISLLKGTSDSMAILFNGITANMTDEQATNVFKKNLESMVRSGELSLESLEKDTAEFSNMVAMNMKTGSNQMEQAGKTLFENFKNTATRGIASTAESIASDMKKMDADTANALMNMGGTWGQVFDGITDITNMSAEEIAKVIETNYSKMGMTSEQVMTAMEQDMNMYITSQQLANTTLSESNQKMVDDMSSIYDSLSMTTTDNVSAIADAVMNTVDGMAIGSVEKIQAMGDGFGRVFAGIEEDGSMSAEQTRAKVVENLTAMMNEGLPIGEMFKSDMIGFLQDMASEGEAKTGEFTSNVTDIMGQLPEGVNIEMSNLPPEVQNALAEAGVAGTTGATEIKDNIINGVEGTSEGVKNNINVSASVQEGVAEGVASANGASAIKDTIIQQTSGVEAGVAINMNGMANTISSAMSTSCSVANSGSAGIKTAIDKNTKVDSAINTNLNNANNAVSNQTKKMAITAETGSKNIAKGVEKGTKDVAKSADTNFKALEKSVKTHMSNASKTARQEATNMYNGVKTSFAQMNSQGTASANSLKNNVINATAIMKNSAIKFWGQIRNEYAKTIKGKIEVTRTIKEEKIVTVSTVNKESEASIASAMSRAIMVEESELAIRQTAVDSLSRLKSNDTISIKDEKKESKTEERRVDDNTGGNKTYITNNYTSPKATSLLELKRQAKRESRKLGVSFR